MRQRWNANLAALIMGGLLLAGCASHDKARQEPVALPETGYEVRSPVRFSPDDWPEPLFADLYLPQRPDPAPAVLLVHGGGWERRSREDMTWIAEELAGRGFAVMNIDYRFAPEYTFPAQLHDLQVAMRWLRQQATTYRIDPDAISAFGFSSGAHLVSLLALTSDPRNPLSKPHGGPGARPVAVVAGGIPSDLRRFDSGRLIRQFLGGTEQEKPEIYRLASPMAHVSPDAPPFFLFHGNLDMLVPPEQAEEFHNALLAKGVHSELYLMHLRGHITSFLTAGNAVEQATEFLVRFGGGPSHQP
ncbi:alpha/beta hydrolase [Marinobacter pelagius]|uniref:Acetyl esterase/lipase n=1 Tax=Marinobacter pelagius TaxID=379482 RepID=A0A1I4RSC5_9GAMM|nr:alpha/beta hydrolase [Marinobacter pelagius]SFM55105.1 Acetyl esterase/lipase [Marinobacter pelagius]